MTLKFKSLVLLCGLTLCSATSVIHANENADTPGLPPVSDFAKHGKYHNIEVSPDGKHFAAELTTNEGKRIVAILDRKTGAITGAFNFKGDEFPTSFMWLNNERVAVYVGIKLGSQDQPVGTGNVIAMNTDGSKFQAIIGQYSPEPVQAATRIINLLPEDDSHILVAEIPYSRKPNFATAHKLNIYTGKKRRVAKGPAKSAMQGSSLLADHDGNVRFATALNAKDGKNIVDVYYRPGKNQDWQLWDSFEDSDNSIEPLVFSPDNKNVYVRSSLNRKTSAIFRYDLETKKSTLVSSNEIVDVANLDFGPKRNLYAVHYEPNYSVVDVIDKDHPIGKWYPAFIKAFNGSQVRITSATNDMSLMTLAVRSDKEPGAFYTFDAKNQKLAPLFKAKPWLKKEFMGTTEAFSIKARDGLDIHGYVTLPKGKSENLPMIVLPHGGPHGPRDYWTYDDDVQLLASRGYAVMKVNFRGSGGYGPEFMKKGYFQWGENIMNDITDSVYWAIKQGIADKDRLCIYGASFGGYASLMSVVKEPDLYKCALGYVGVYDMRILQEKGDVPGSIYGKNFLDKVIGNDETQLDKFSPARHVDKIKADLFIVHGEKDIRAHFDHALDLKDKLDKASIPYEWMTKEKEGHGFYDETNREELYHKMLAFFEKNIGKG
ncbi:MAG: S9 family peptidase [Pseudomonadota bacterium]|nr:S9 family peptidase [Pseudomonadota bacterium]